MMTYPHAMPLLISILIVLLLVLVLSLLKRAGIFLPSFGRTPGKDAKQRYDESPNYRNGRFQNLELTPMNPEDFSPRKVMMGFLRDRKLRRPPGSIKNLPINKEVYTGLDNNPLITWLGHSGLLVRIGGKNILCDPVFSPSASPFSFAGIKAFAYDHPYSTGDLPAIDIFLLTHDHYDHMDYKLIRKLRNKAELFIVPLGVGQHLEHWGIEPGRIREMDWWESLPLDENLSIVATPGRHFTGRGLGNRNSTLWCGWAIKDKIHSILLGGDSGYGSHFKEIGERLGPFDLAALECGQYNENWPFIHMMPEQTVQAGIDVRAGTLLPIHWGRFSLSLHPWNESPERALAASRESGIKLLTPRIGETVAAPFSGSYEPWWR